MKDNRGIYSAGDIVKDSYLGYPRILLVLNLNDVVQYTDKVANYQCIWLYDGDEDMNWTGQIRNTDVLFKQAFILKSENEPV